MPPHKRLELLSLIRNSQNADGSFDSELFSGDSKVGTSRNTFTTSLILNCLSALQPTRGTEEEGILDCIVRDSVDFLLREKSPSWSWNYWRRDGDGMAGDPCPDDLDDTATALSAIASHRPDLITGETLAHVTRALTLSEDRVGGPYHTWIIDRKRDGRWHDVDVVVNANIASFLGSQGVRLPRLIAFTESCIEHAEFPSKYYEPLAAAYAVARWYNGPLRGKLASIVAGMRRTEESWGDALSDALAVSTLARLGTQPSPRPRSLKNAEAAHIEATPFYIEGIKETGPLRSGSRALTAAFILEADALSNPEGTPAEAGVDEHAPPNDHAAQRIHEEILKKTIESLNIFPRKTIGKIESTLSRMTSRDPGKQITLLPYFFSRSINHEGRIPQSIVIELGVTNLLGWLAYKIYDDILDDEGDPSLLPAANVCLRLVTESYHRVLPEEHRGTFDELMNAIERANAWERESCRIGKRSGSGVLIEAMDVPLYSNHAILADKSLAHALGPVTVLTAMSNSHLAGDMRQTLGFFRNYLIARQLNDDAHDWITDLERGFVNSVSSRVLKAYFSHIAPIASCNITDKKRELERIFWNKTVDETLNDINNHILQARNNLGKIKVISDTSYLESLLAPLERAAEKTASEKKKTLDFLESYRGSA